MSSLLSKEESDSLSLVFNDIHETFAQDVIAIKVEKRIILSEDPNFISLYSDAQKNESVDYVPVSGFFKGRIKWMDIEAKNATEIYHDFKPETFANYCRLKVDSSGLNFIKGCKEIWIDSIKCDWNGQYRPHGLFKHDFYTLYLRASE